ncbi:MAG: transcription antitermination factor NusB [Gemmataceae bacterium]|nr:transcription antitermination factor NusB [Gemmataceae bacterium]MCS7271893.1 transcription antitermination factor NusB [Gemmataceae bacterium]MDW8244013.1 transcription antitermination factor NusB [Thermogemmata sp.]
MYARSRAREVALQLLFEREFHPRPLPREQIEEFVHHRLQAFPDQIAYCLYLYDGVEQHRAAIDRLLSEVLDNWRLSRLHTGDRNVLRLATFQLLYDKDQLPTAVIIDEAVTLANRFGTEESARFVMGILDRIAQRRGETPPAQG